MDIIEEIVESSKKSINYLKNVCTQPYNDIGDFYINDEVHCVENNKNTDEPTETNNQEEHATKEDTEYTLYHPSSALYYENVQEYDRLMWQDVAFVFIGTVLSCAYSDILLIASRWLFGSGLICLGVGASFVVVGYTTHWINSWETTRANSLRALEEESQHKQTFQYKYGEFITDYTDQFTSILSDPVLMSEYSNQDENYIKRLAEKQEHLHMNLPYDKNNKIVMYYDPEEEKFMYFTQNSDILYRDLNTCCRNYVLSKKCVHLFLDDAELEYLKSQSNKLDFQSNAQENPQEDAQEKQQEETKKEEIINSFETVDGEEDDDDENKDPPQRQQQSIFYNKKEKSKQNPRNVPVEKRINSFKRGGTIEDYNLKFREKPTPKNMDYNAFKSLFQKI